MKKKEIVVGDKFIWLDIDGKGKWITTKVTKAQQVHVYLDIRIAGCVRFKRDDPRLCKTKQQVIEYISKQLEGELEAQSDILDAHGKRIDTLKRLKSLL